MIIQEHIQRPPVTIYSAARLHGILVFLVLISACDNADDTTEYSAIEPRVASYSSGQWTVTARPNDPFNTAVSLFSQQLNSPPMALRVVGGTVTLGRWGSGQWNVTEVVSGAESPIDATSEDEDQLYSGILVSGEGGRATAAFVTRSGSFFTLFETTDGQFVLESNGNASILCYDLSLDSAGHPMLSWTHSDYGVRLSTFNDLGQQTEEDVSSSFACSSLAVDPVGGKIGVILWAANDALTAMNTTLAEKSVEGVWSYRAIASDGRLEQENTYIPQLSYRSDSAAIVSHVDRNFVLSVLEELPDDLFDEYALTTTGQTFMMTGFQRSASGEVYAAYAVDKASIRLFRTADEEGTPSTGASLLGLDSFPGVYPRLALSSSGPFVSYWDALGSLLAFAPGELEPVVIDEATSLGYLLGSKIYVWTEGDQSQVQVFYNEIHAL